MKALLYVGIVVGNIAVYIVVLVLVLYQPVMSFLVCGLCLASSYIQPSLHLFDFCKNFF